MNKRILAGLLLGGMSFYMQASPPKNDQKSTDTSVEVREESSCSSSGTCKLRAPLIGLISGVLSAYAYEKIAFEHPAVTLLTRTIGAAGSPIAVGHYVNNKTTNTSYCAIGSDILAALVTYVARSLYTRNVLPGLYPAATFLTTKLAGAGVYYTLHKHKVL